MILYAILVLVLALAIALSWSILRLGRDPSKSRDGKLDLEFPCPRPTIARAFSQEDLHYLLTCEQSTPQLVKRFRQTHRRVLGLFLRDLRRDFYCAWSVCRQLAPLSKDPDFAFKLSQSFVIFHGLYLRVWLRSQVGDFGSVKLEALADLLGQWRESAGQLVQVAQVQAAAASA